MTLPEVTPSPQRQGLLSSGSSLTQAVAVDLVRAEAARALHLLRAIRVLKGEVMPARRAIHARTMLRRVVDETEADRRLRGLTWSAENIGAGGLSLIGAELLPPHVRSP